MSDFPPLPNYLTLEEAAQAMTDRTGRQWTPRHILGCAERHEIFIFARIGHAVRFVRVQPIEGRTNEIACAKGSLPILDTEAIRALLLAGEAHSSGWEEIATVDFLGEPIEGWQKVFELAPGEVAPTVRPDGCRVTAAGVLRLVDAYTAGRTPVDNSASDASLLKALSKAPAQPAPQPNPILFHPDLIDREFGSHLIAVPKLTDWAAKRGLEVDTQPPIGGFQFVQVEAFLCAIECAARESMRDEQQAAAIVQATPRLAQDRAAEVAPRWLVGADAHMQWRRLLERAVEAGELVLLHFGSKLPVQASTEPRAAEVVEGVHSVQTIHRSRTSPVPKTAPVPKTELSRFSR